LDSDTFNSSVHESCDKSQKNIFLKAERLFLPETPQIQAFSGPHFDM
jgi:hypothetical protein